MTTALDDLCSRMKIVSDLLESALTMSRDDEPGAMYSSVPTNELVLKSAMHILVSTNGTPFGVMCLIPAGAPPASDCLDRSKSLSMM